MSVIVCARCRAGVRAGFPCSVCGNEDRMLPPERIVSGGVAVWRNVGDAGSIYEWHARDQRCEHRGCEPGRWYPEPDAAALEAVVEAARLHRAGPIQVRHARALDAALDRLSEAQDA